MKTNFEELLNNTNLSMIDILLYYQEEIASEIRKYKKFFTYAYFHPKDDYEEYINHSKRKEEQTKLVNLVIEFTELVKYIINKYYKGHYLPLNVLELKYKLARETEYNSDNIQWLEEYLNEYVKIIIQGLWNNIFQVYSDEDQQKVKILRRERKDINAFYISELNRQLDEKEAKIYELEVKSFQDQQDINALIVENQDLKRVLEINREGEE